MNYYSFIENLVSHKIVKSNREWLSGIDNIKLLDIRAKYHEQTLNIFNSYFYSSSVFFDAGKSRGNYIDSINAPKIYDYPNTISYEHCPLMHGTVHQDTKIFGGDSGALFEDEHKANNQQRINRLKFYLLYSHKVILPDPMFYICQFFAHSDSIFIDDSKQQLIGFLDFLYEIKKLVKMNVVLFYPQYEHSEHGFSRSTFVDKDYAEWLNINASTLDKNAIYPGDKPDYANVIFSYEQSQISQLMFFCNRYNASLYFDNHKHELLMNTYLKYAYLSSSHINLRTNDKIHEKERRILERLIDIPLPNLSKLSLNDIASVRTNCDSFNDWRKCLGEGIDRIESGNDYKQIKQALIRTLVPKKEKLEQEIKNSNILSSAKTNLSNFGVGALAGVVAGDPTGGLATGTATTGITVLKEFLCGYKNRSSNKSLLKHYTVVVDEK